MMPKIQKIILDLSPHYKEKSIILADKRERINRMSHGKSRKGKKRKRMDNLEKEFRWKLAPAEKQIGILEAKKLSFEGVMDLAAE